MGWKLSIDNVRHALLPSFTSRPNPFLHADTLLVSLFSPGSLRALDVATGIERWRLNEGRYSGRAPSCVSNCVIWQTNTTVYALDLNDGQQRWAVCPHGNSGEHIYSEATVAGEAVFFGDRHGHIHAVSLEDGGALWATCIATGKNNDVNSRGLAFEDRIIFGTNASEVVACALDTGKILWRVGIDSPSINEILRFGDEVVVASVSSVYKIDPRTGDVRERLHWNGHEVAGAIICDSILVMTLRPPIDEHGPAMGPGFRLVGFDAGRQRYMTPVGDSFSAMTYSPISNLLYGSGYDGATIVDPASGSTVGRILGDSGYGAVRVGSVSRNALFVICGPDSDGGNFHIMALPHPP